MARQWPEQGDEELDVLPLHWGEAEAPMHIGTVGASPCIAIAVMNDTRRLAWVYHWPLATQGEDDLRDMIAEILAASNLSTDHVRVVIGGGKGNTDAERSHAVRLVEDGLKPVSPKVAWGYLSYLMLEHDGSRWCETGEEAPDFA